MHSRAFLTAAALLAVLATASTAPATVIQYGDKDVLGTKSYDYEPTTGATLQGLAPGVVTSATLIQGHGFPFDPQGDYAGTDQIYVGYPQGAQYDGYSRHATRAYGPQVITMDYGAAVPQGHHVTTLTLGLAADDFQQPSWHQPFSAWVNGQYDATLSGGLNALNQTGPKVQFHTIGIDTGILQPNHELTLTIDEDGTGGDGWAIDFLTIGVTTAQDPATIGLSNVVNDTIITGGTGLLGCRVTNTAGAGSANLDYTLGAGVKTGSVSLGAVQPGTGSLAPSQGADNTVTAGSTLVGQNVVTFTCTDAGATNSPQAVDATLTVLDPSHASLAAGSALVEQTIDFGLLLRNAVVPSRPFAITNRAVGHPAEETAGLDLDSFTPNGGSPLTTNLATFTNHPAGGTDSFAASLATGTKGEFARTVTIGLSDRDLPGAGAPGSQTLAVHLQAVVGNAVAGRDGYLGPYLSANVKPGGPYAGLESTVVRTRGEGEQEMVGSTATILAGDNNTIWEVMVGMAWRTRLTSETDLCSDVMSLAMIAGIPGPASEGPAGDEAHVLQIDYDEALLPADEATMAGAGELFLGYFTAADGWLNAIEGNDGENTGTPNVQGPWKGQMALGTWGVDIDRDVVWAVLDYSACYHAVAPEPTALCLLGLGGLALLRRRGR